MLIVAIAICSFVWKVDTSTIYYFREVSTYFSEPNARENNDVAYETG